ncbi:hypothetical protein C8J57DRAFT_1484601 [Mycena rebaudengoi]|nr:hypothetical protein C8J57DRAFT_1484601 [Mycena rebaudengoi]
MPSFNTMISALAAVAFASLSFAAPVDIGGVAVSVPINLDGDGVLGTFVPVVGHSYVDVAADTGAVSVSARASTPLPEILTNLGATLKPVTAEIAALTAGDFSIETLTPLINQVISIINEAVADMQGLAGSSLQTILGTADIAQVAALLASVLSIVFTALGAVSGVASGAGAGADIAPIIGQVSGVVSALLRLVLSLVPGLIGALLPLVGPLLSTITNLGLSNILGLLLGNGLLGNVL